jgi:hypothetical protein
LPGLGLSTLRSRVRTTGTSTIDEWLTMTEKSFAISKYVVPESLRAPLATASENIEANVGDMLQFTYGANT